MPDKELTENYSLFEFFFFFFFFLRNKDLLKLTTIFYIVIFLG